MKYFHNLIRINMSSGLHFAMTCSIMLCLSFPCHSQVSHFEKVFTTDHGLPHNHVLSIAYDKTGFLWIGTWDGLCRYDGYEFHNYFHDPEDSTSIPLFNIGTIKVDKKNNIWLFSLSNVLAHYVKSRDNFKSINYRRDPVLSATGIECIETGPDSCLWIAGAGGLARNDGDVNNFRKVEVLDARGKFKSLTGIINITFDNRGDIWISTTKDFIQGEIHHDTGRYQVKIKKVFNSADFGKALVPNSFRYAYGFVHDDRDVPWFTSNIGCYSLKPDFQYHDVSLLNWPENFRQTLNKTTWFRNRNSIIILSAQGEKTVIQLPDDEFPSVVIADDNQSVWYSTITTTGMGTGLHRYYKTPDHFKHYLTEINSKPVVVYSVTTDRDRNLLIGTQGNHYIAVISEKGKPGKLNELEFIESAKARHARSMISDSSGIWLGYMQDRLDYYDYTRKSVTHVFLKKEGSDNTREPLGFRTLYVDSRGNLLVGTLGLFVYTPAGKEKFRFLWGSDPPGKNVFCINEDPGGTVWAGTSRLLLKLNQDYTVDSAYTVSENEYNIEDICFGSNGDIWLALLGGGLELFNPVTGKREFFTTKDGLSNNTIYSILKDKHGNLWISTDNGISQFNPATRKFRIFGYTDGLMIHEFNSDAAFQSAEGKMYFGGMGGVVGFYPDSILKNESMNFKDRLILTEFRVSGIPRYFDEPVYEAQKIRLDKGDDNFRITFANLDFKNSDKIKYRYKLSGHDENWIETDHLHRSISFAGLKPRKYILQVESTGNQGEYTGHLDLEIIIPPYFYQTTWFLLLMIMTGILIIVVFFIFNNRQIRMRESQKQHYLKLESIRGQMNPHFIFNSLNSINYFIAKSDRLSANRYISSFSKLIRSFLNNMSHEYISLNEEIASINDYLKLEFLRFGDKFNYSINNDHIEDLDKWEVFPGMIQPFIENAIWHGVRGLQYRKGFIMVDFFENTDHRLQCMITDDGVGRKLSEQNKNVYTNRKSKGLFLIHERMQIINHLEKRDYQIIMEDLYPEKEECGTRVIIDIPSRINHKV